MKRISFFSIAMFLLFSVILIAGCKKNTDKSDCKTCKAYSIDGLVGEEEVCSEAEEQAFRNEFTGKEISCQ